MVRSDGTAYVLCMGAVAFFCNEDKRIAEKIGMSVRTGMLLCNGEGCLLTVL